MDNFPSRRQYLLGVTTASTTGIAGCSGNTFPGQSGEKTTNGSATNETDTDGDENAPEVVARRYITSIAEGDKAEYEQLTYRNRTFSGEKGPSFSIDSVEEVSLATVADSKGYDLSDEELEAARLGMESMVTDAGGEAFAIVEYTVTDKSEGAEESGHLTLLKDNDRWFVFEEVRAAAVLRNNSNPQGQTLVFAKSYTLSGSDATVEEGTPVREDMLTAPDSVLVYPNAKVGINDALIRLHRLEPDKIAPPTNMDGTASGYVAYSALCTHLGCTVDWDESGETATGRPTDHCYCHGSQFDPYEGAKVVQSPAERPLPQVSVRVSDDGTVQLASDFEEEVGQ